MQLDLQSTILWLIPCVNLIAFLSIVVLHRLLTKSAHLLTIFGSGLSAILALVVLTHVFAAETTTTNTIQSSFGEWFKVSNFKIAINFKADVLSSAMLFIITFVSTWIAIFSAGYMHGDPGYPRYFALMSLFVFCMCCLVLTTNLIVLFAFWEGVGVCSYLLVGYWTYKRSAAVAAWKAFLVTRLGDVAFIFGILLLWYQFGFNLEYQELFSQITAARMEIQSQAAGFRLEINPNNEFSLDNIGLSEAQERLKRFDNGLCLIFVLIFCGAIGKSAQFPLHVWLPDAMEGPTPVSALIHAATMVTAGVYLVARLSPVIALIPDATLLIACIGAFTALFAATIAMLQYDLKRILAYSTISQLGYMFLALGCMTSLNCSVAVGAALFHLMTHAFFKALLFLSAGSIMHATGDVIDIRKLGGLRKLMPVTHVSFLIGVLCLVGLVPFSGFWSKDHILEVILDRAESDLSNRAYIYYLLFGVAVLTAAITAFYSFRAYFKTFWGRPADQVDNHHPHKFPLNMALPLIILAAGSATAGMLATKLDYFSNQFITEWFASQQPHNHEHSIHSPNYWLIATTVTIVLVTAALTYFLYGTSNSEMHSLSQEEISNIVYNRFYVDELYSYLVIKPLIFLANLAKFIEQIMIALVMMIAQLPKIFVYMLQLRYLQNGLLQFYGISMILGVAIFMIFLLLILIG